MAPQEHPLGIGEGGVEHLRQPVDNVGAEDDIHKGIALLKALGHVLLLRHAAAHGDDGGGMAALDVLQGPHVAKDPVLGVFPHSAGVEEDKIRLLRGTGEFKAHLAELALDFLPVGHILLAAVGAHIGQGHRPPCPDFHHLSHIGHIEFLPGKFFLGKLVFQGPHSSSINTGCVPLVFRAQPVGSIAQFGKNRKGKALPIFGRGKRTSRRQGRIYRRAAALPLALAICTSRKGIFRRQKSPRQTGGSFVSKQFYQNSTLVPPAWRMDKV